MVDLETLGKSERQGHLDTVMNTHTIADVQNVRTSVPKGRLLVRTNPLHENSLSEIDALIDAGADILMLPWFHSVSEVRKYAKIVNGRARIHLLVETKGAKQNLLDCCKVDGIERVHIGLNDLSLELNRRFMFELLIDGTVEEMVEDLRKVGMPFGIGGVARVGEGLLPAERILVEHARLGSDAAILSRTFHRGAASPEEIEQTMDFVTEVSQLRDVYLSAKQLKYQEYRKNLAAVRSAVAEIRAMLPDRGPRSI
jgi:2-keto-3-deoxy-L-rhamnonate aldolase RhmA